MSEFYIGQKVVCVDDKPVAGDPRTLYVKQGKVYVLSAIFNAPAGLLGVTLEGVPHYDALGYYAYRFRPLEYKAMQIFRAIAANPTIKIREDA